MKNQEHIQWSVLPENAEVLRSVLEIRSSILQKNAVDLLLLSIATLVRESTCCCSIPRMLRLYHD